MSPDEGKFSTGRDVSRGVMGGTGAKASLHGWQYRLHKKTICVSAVQRLSAVRNVKLQAVHPSSVMNCLDVHLLESQSDLFYMLVCSYSQTDTI